WRTGRVPVDLRVSRLLLFRSGGEFAKADVGRVNGLDTRWGMIHVSFTTRCNWDGEEPMGRKSPNLKLSLPRCRNCNRYWRPAAGVVASGGYCQRCANARRAAATSRLALKRIGKEDIQGAYLLPRRFRPG